MKHLLYVATCLLALSRATYAIKSLVSDQLDNEARLLAAYSTRTVYALTTTTATVWTTCNKQGAGTNVCQRRRVKRFQSMTNSALDDTGDSAILELESALADVPNIYRSKRDADPYDREGKIALTVWTTTSSTYTVTSTSTNPATTFSVSYYCTVLGSNMASACG